MTTSSNRRPMHKTKLMKKVEAQQGKPLETLLPQLLSEYSQTEVAAMLGVNGATISYWKLKFRLSLTKVVTSPGESIEVRHTYE